MTALRDRLREAFRRCASGVSIITTDGSAGRTGITVSSLSSLSLDPPSVIMCVHRMSHALPALLANGVFAASVLAEDQARVADAFAGLIPELRADRFAAGEWRRLATGAPVLEGSIAAFDCRLAAQFDFGSHRILVGRVLDIWTSNGAPLVYAGRGYRRLKAASRQRRSSGADAPLRTQGRKSTCVSSCAQAT